MLPVRTAWTVAWLTVLLAACGKDSPTAAVSTSTTRGALEYDPPLRIASLDAAAFAAKLAATGEGTQLLALAGVPACGVDFYYLNFWTLGGFGETTESSGALMVPTGAPPACSGPRPIVLYAHATNTDKALNIADITDASNTEGALIAAVFAAQGYIVVAPNYAGYDISTLGYHPFLNAIQQSGEMMDILTAARTALPNTFAAATRDGGQLFVAGYSEGGHVALATLRALQAAGSTVTAAAPMSGPYALEAFVDTVFFGSVDVGSTAFAPLLTTSYQHAYGKIYTATTDIYSPTYAAGIDTLLPSETPLTTLFAQGLLPPTALFDLDTPSVVVPNDVPLSTALTLALAPPAPTSSLEAPFFDLGFGSPFLINNTFRSAYAIDAGQDPDGALPAPLTHMPLPGAPLAAVPPTQNFRLAVYKNDLRNGGWAPQVPTLLCGGGQDPTVFFGVNTGTMQTFWSGLPEGLLTVLDVNAAPAGPFAAVQGAFQASQKAELGFYESPAGGSQKPAAAAAALVAGYHAAVAPFCTIAARDFFSQF